MATREGEAATAEEDTDAVVLMTIHAAKGLEFDVVVLADCGRERAARAAADVLVDGDGKVALRAPRPDRRRRCGPRWASRDAADAERAAEAEEARRLQYVALTRARQHLIGQRRARPGRGHHHRPHLQRARGGAGCAPATSTSGEARLLVRVTRAGDAGRRGTPARSDAAGPRSAASWRCSPSGAPQPLDAAAAGARRRPWRRSPLRRLSYSALALYRRCGYRYFAQRVLGLPEPDGRARARACGLDPLELGDAVHLELERADDRWRAAYPQATPENVELVASFVANWRGSALAARVAALDARAPRGAVRVRGGRGALPRPPGRVRAAGGPAALLIVDYKTNRLGERSAEEVVDASYGVAGHDLRAGRAARAARSRVRDRLRLPGATATASSSASFTAADADGLEAELRGGDRRTSGRPASRPGRGRTAWTARRSTCCAPARRWSGSA